MSATRLLVLGVVRMQGQTHGYRVMRELLNWSADKWANLQPGSVYHVLKKGAAEGLLDPVTVESTGSGPSRTSYRLTEDGEREFLRLVERYLSEPDPTGFNFSAAVAFMTCLPRMHVISLLEYLRTQIDGSAQTTRHAAEQASEWGQPAHVTELYRFWTGHMDATMHWLAGLIDRLRSGEYEMADDTDDPFGAPPAPSACQ